tara:strand:+ start:1771 stop:2400 length:630 start_codon:yes stop_codon:yes gene_type:complete
MEKLPVKLPFLNETTVLLVGPCAQTAELNNYSKSQIIYVDGGGKYMSYPKNGFLIGDNDSLNQENNDFDLLFASEKDFSDLMGTLNLLGDSQKEVILSGFSGGRLDHFFCVLGDCFNHLRIYKETIIYLDKNIVIYPAGSHKLNFNDNFSLLSFDTNTIDLTGKIAYPCENLTTYPGSGQLLSNKAEGKFLLKSDHPIAIIKGSYCVDQ